MKNMKIKLLQVNIYHVETVSFSNLEKLANLLETKTVKGNGNILAKCNIEVNYIDIRNSIAEILDINTKHINLIYDELQANEKN